MSRSVIDRYLYWSGRRVAEIASDSGLHLERTAHMMIKTPSIAGFQAEFAAETRTATRAKIAARLERALSGACVEDLTSTQPGAVRFACGTGVLVASEFAGTRGTVLHTCVESAGTGRIDLCLFGSMDNLAGFQQADSVEAGWSSSAWYAIEELLDSRGRKNTSQWDDEQSRSFEALKIALQQGSDGSSAKQEPRTRGYTLGHTGPAQWFAEIYTDAVLDPTRWHLDGAFEGTHRIMVGAPVWVRARHYTRYSGRRTRRWPLGAVAPKH